MKADYPPGGLPCWEENGRKMNETNALFRYLGKKFGYYPKDLDKAWEVDALFDLVYSDYFGKFKDPQIAYKIV